MDATMMRQAASCVDEALHVYRTSTTAWETATAYYRPSDSPRPHANQVSDPGVRHHSTQPLPPTFISQYNNVRYKSFMGLFPQINRAWLTVDSNLFLCAYTPLGSTTPASDLYVYEGFSQIIVSVALITPRPGVFVESVRYLIAVATTVEVTLLGVTFSPTGQLNLIPTQISIPTDNIMMLKILSSDDGRIFMAGADGGLHQFVYAPNHSSSLFDLFSTRPRKRARKIAHSSSVASYLLPTAIKSWFNSQNELVDLAIEGNALFTLSQAGVLTVYDVSDNQVRMVATSKIAADAKPLFNFSVSPSEREFVSIHPVTASASSSVQLIVVTSLGERIYYSTRTSAVSSALHPSPRPCALRCVAYRPSPDIENSRSSHPCVHISLCHRGAAIFADLKDAQADRLICVYPDVNIMQSGRGDSPVNSARTGEIVLTTSLDIASPQGMAYHSHGMQPMTPMTPATQPNMGGGGTSFGEERRTFAMAEAEIPDLSQNGPMDPPYFFWVLTATAIHLFERVNPMDRLRDVLSKYHGNNDVVKLFFDRYGVADSCSMCLEIAITNPPLARVAANVFYTAGGSVGWNRGISPSAVGSTRRRTGERTRENFSFQQQSRFDVGRAAVEAMPTARFSGAHDGITLYLAKVLHPIWDNFITTNRNMDAYQDLTDRKDVLVAVRDQLLAVSAFLERYAPEDLLPKVRTEDDERMDRATGDRLLSTRSRRRSQDTRRGGGVGMGDDDTTMNDRIVHGLYELKRTDEARRLESNAIKGLVKLATRAAEALALMLIVHDHQIHRLAVSMGEVGRKKLVESRWHDLIANEDGNILASSLIESMFSLYDDESVAMTSVGGLLQERCPGFFGNVDEQLHHGLSLLRQAVVIYNESGIEQGVIMDNGMDGLQSAGWMAAMNKADEAVTVLKRVAGNIYDMKSVFNEFKRMKAIAGLVDVGLTIGTDAEERKDDERADVAFKEVMNVVKDLMREGGDDGGQQQQQQGSAGAYDDVGEGVREASLRLALNCKSERFLLELYTMLRESRRGLEMLLKEWSTNVEKFLLEHNSLETLWKYYAQHGRYFEAATVLLKLAETSKVGLVDRLNLLSCALLNAKSATAKGDERASGLLVEVTDFLDVAKVQVQIREQLASGGAAAVVANNINNSINDENEDGKNGSEVSENELKLREAEIKQAVKELDEEILSLSVLFNRYAREFGLLECCLECLRCGSYRDDNYVRQVWRDIVLRESCKTESRRLVGHNLEVIGRQFYPSEVVMPIGHVVEMVEMINLELYGGDDLEWGVNVMRGIGVPLTDLVEEYCKLLEKSGKGEREIESERAQEMDMDCWNGEKGEMHVLKVMEVVVRKWIEEVVSRNANENSHSGNANYSKHGRRMMMHQVDKGMRVVQLGKARLRGMKHGVSNVVWTRYEKLEDHLALLTE